MASISEVCSMILLDLLSHDTTLRRVASTRGGEYAGPCPWCDGRDRFRVWPYADRPGYWCRRRNRTGDAIQYLRDRHGLTYREACARLGLPLDARPTLPRPHAPKPPPLAVPPNQAWQVRTRAFIERCEQLLWTPVGAQALDYLQQRGLQIDTIRAARLGYHPAERWEHPAQWGLEPEHRKIHLLRGIVFPWCVGSELWRVLFRREGDHVPKDERYKPIAGGGNTFYQVDTLRPHAPAMMVEGVLDALAVRQEASDLIAVVAAGTTSGRKERWIGRLDLASTVLIALDADAAGDMASGWWLKTLGPRARRWRPFWDDPAAMLQDGANLRTWVREGLGPDPKWWQELARWREDRQELWAERAAIMEVEGGHSRDGAEREAFEMLRDAAERQAFEVLRNAPSPP
jgi:DNA primase